MKVSELRIGNKFLFNGMEDTIDAVDFHVPAFIEDEDENQYAPMPITTKILLDFGFEKQKEDLYRTGYYTLIVPFHIHIVRGDFIYYADWSHPVIIKYVHQLQNLYFAITGEELETK